MFVDFNRGMQKTALYGGSDKKRKIVFTYPDNTTRTFMVKFPDPRKNNRQSYCSNQYSEDIGCRIFKSCGFDTQTTFLGNLANDKGEQRIVVGCEDFTTDGSILCTIKDVNINNTEIDGDNQDELTNIIKTINESNIIPGYLKPKIQERFWDMCIIDALIGNTDRHLGNWGLLEQNDEISFAPIYDCGSSLAAYQTDTELQKALSKLGTVKGTEKRITSRFMHNNKKVVYLDLLKNPPEEFKTAVENAILRVTPQINIDNIVNIINDTEKMSDVRKQYLRESVQTRYDDISNIYRSIVKTRQHEAKQAQPVTSSNIIDYDPNTGVKVTEKDGVRQVTVDPAILDMTPSWEEPSLTNLPPTTTKSAADDHTTHLPGQ